MTFDGQFKGFFCGALAAAAYGMNPLFALPLYRDGIGTSSVLFYRIFLGALLLGVIMLIRRQPFRLPKSQLLYSIGSGVLLATTCLFWFMSFKIMDSGIGATLLFVYPIMVAGIMAAFFHEKTTWTTLLGILLALGGVAILCLPSGGGANVNLRGSVYIILSALIYAVYIVLVKESPLKELAPETLTFYAMLFALPWFLLPLRGGLDLQILSTAAEWGNAFGLALFPGLLSFLLMAVAVRCIGATKTAILGALEPMTAVVIGVLVFHEKMSWTLLFGIVVILGAVTLVVHSTQSKNGKTV